MIANTQKSPYVSAVFASIRTDIEERYNKMNDLTFKELENMEGYLRHEAFRDENGFGVNVSYWKDMNALNNRGK